MTLDESKKALQNLDSLRLRNKNVKNARLLDQQRVKAHDDYEKKLYDFIVEYVVKEVLSEYHGRQSYFSYQVNDDTFWVFLKEYKTFSRNPANRTVFIGYMVPKYAFVRTVKVIEKRGSNYLVCSCGNFARFGWGCRHCYKVRETCPIPEDCVVRCRIDYLRYFNKPGFENLTRMFQECLRNEPPGIPLSDDFGVATEVGQGDAPIGLLQERTQHMVTPREGQSMVERALIRPGNHWHLRDATVVHVEGEECMTQNTQPMLRSIQQPMQHEENLSQYAQEVNELSQQVEDASTTGVEEGADASNFNEEFPMTINISYPTTEQVQENRVAISQGGGAYNNMMPLFQQMTNLADTNPYLYDILWQSLNQTSALMNSEAVSGYGSYTEGSILTQPSVDRTKWCSRKKQRTSPSKRKK